MHLLLGLLIAKGKGKIQRNFFKLNSCSPCKGEGRWCLCQVMRGISILFGLWWDAFGRCVKEENSSRKTQFSIYFIYKSLEPGPKKAGFTISSKQKQGLFKCNSRIAQEGTLSRDNDCCSHGNCKPSSHSPAHQSLSLLLLFSANSH